MMPIVQGSDTSLAIDGQEVYARQISVDAECNIVESELVFGTDLSPPEPQPAKQFMIMVLEGVYRFVANQDYDIVWTVGELQMTSRGRIERLSVDFSAGNPITTRIEMTIIGGEKLLADDIPPTPEPIPITIGGEIKPRRIRLPKKNEVNG